MNLSSESFKMKGGCEGTNVFAVFHGYLKWDKKKKEWNEDEWLTQIYGTLKEAKTVIERFAEGHPFDNDRELQVTRYFGESDKLFDRGEELSKDNPDVVMREWMRYAEYQLIR